MNQKESGIILSWTTQGILVLSGLIYTPIALRILGQNEYGLYQLTGSVVSYLGLLGFGHPISDSIRDTRPSIMRMTEKNWQD